MLQSCKDEEDLAEGLSGSWEGDMKITHTYNGRTITPTKTIFTFYREGKHSTVGDGNVVEYYNASDFPMTVYRRLRWETWTRKSGDAAVQIKLENEDVKYSIYDWDMNEEAFAGVFSTETLPDTEFRLFRLSSSPDVSNVKHWGYNELLPTWHRVTFEGQLDVRREYEGTIYKPTSVVITFDTDPAYNDGGPWNGPAYVMEKFENAPWGNVLADSIKDWRISNDTKEMTIYFANSQESWGDYKFYNLVVNENTLSGEIFVETNVFTPFTMRRTTEPNWNAITEWGINK